MAKGQNERKRGHFANAILDFEQASELARSSGESSVQAHALVAIAGCQIRLFDYRRALASAETGFQLARQANDDTWAGAASGNKATVYSQLGDYSLAQKAAAQSVQYLGSSPRKDYLARALLNLGDIQARLGEDRNSVASFQKAVALAHSAGAIETEAMAEDHMGESLLEAGDLAGAQKALLEARTLRVRMKDADALTVTDENLAWLAYLKGDSRYALTLIDRVLAARSSAESEIPAYWPLELRGQFLLAQHRQSEALASFDRAVRAADQFRRRALPGDTTSTRTVVALHEVYQDYISLAAKLALERRDLNMASRAYDVLIASRAASLRDQMVSSLSREMRLPPRYFELLAQLETTQALVTLGADPKVRHANDEKSRQVRLQLSELENKVGLDETNQLLNSPSRDPNRTPLRQVQQHLSRQQLLLSFFLGKEESFLWAVTSNRLKLYRLPPESQIAAETNAFTQSVRATDSGPRGRVLSRELFGQLAPELEAKSEWLIAADGVLLNSVPFSALPDFGSSQSPAWLVTRHSMRFLPSELLLAAPHTAEPHPTFVGVADPIYNLADSRRFSKPNLLPIEHSNDVLTLARLVGSDREVRTAAQESGETKVQLLTGRNASRASLREALSQTPQLLHFAVHVVGPEGARHFLRTNSDRTRRLWLSVWARTISRSCSPKKPSHPFECRELW